MMSFQSIFSIDFLFLKSGQLIDLLQSVYLCVQMLNVFFVLSRCSDLHLSIPG